MPGNIATPPVSVYASWPKPNLENPDRMVWLAPVVTSLHAFSSLLIATRLWLRSRRSVGGLGLDDALLVPAWLVATGCVALICYASDRAFTGIHIWDVPADEWWEVALNAWLSQLFFLVGTCLLKVSVLLFSLRMVEGSYEARWRFIILLAVGFTVAWTLALALVLVLNCNPVKAYWMAYDMFWLAGHEYKCSDTRFLNPLSGALAIASDIYSIVIPLVVCWNLRLSRRQRLGLNVLFGASIMAVGAACGRTWALTRIGHDYDASWHSTWVFFWSNFEFELGLICTCIPTLRALFKSAPKSFRGDSSRGLQESSSSNGTAKRPTVISKKSQHSRDESWIELQ